MATFFVHRYFKVLIFLVFHFDLLAAYQSSPFSFKSFEKDSNFEANFTLYGDAEVVTEKSSIQLSGAVSPGRVMFKKPISLVGGKVGDLIYFSTHFSFSLSNHSSLGFVVVPNPSGLKNDSLFVKELENKNQSEVIISIEFVNSIDVIKDNETSKNHVRVYVGDFVSEEVSNLSRLQSWVDYNANSQRFEVRLGKSSDVKPVHPFRSYNIGLTNVWNQTEMLVGLSLFSENTSEMLCYIHSWSFSSRYYPRWMHTVIADPDDFADEAKPLVVEKPSVCVYRIVGALMLGVACGALGAVMVAYLWAVFGNRRPVVPEECAVVDFEYTKVKVNVDKALEQDGKKTSV